MYTIFFPKSLLQLDSKSREEKWTSPAELLSCSYDVICFTETWLDSTVFDHKLVNNDDPYNIYRRDRDTSSSFKNTGGGALIAYKKEIIFTLVSESNSKSTEDIWIEFKLK